MADEKFDDNDINAEDCSKFKTKLREWSNENLISSIRDRFVTGDWSKAAQRGKLANNGEDDENIYGDFEDLETGKTYGGGPADYADANANNDEDDDLEQEERRLKKLALRAKFDAQYPFFFPFKTCQFAVISSCHYHSLSNHIFLDNLVAMFIPFELFMIKPCKIICLIYIFAEIDF